MADITPLFVESLKKHHVSAIGSSRRSQDRLDDFLKEAYRISSHISSLRAYLTTIRQPYLSASQPHRRRDVPGSPSIRASLLADGSRQSLSDQQRDQIDAEAKQLLRDVNTAIHNLSEAERLRHKAQSTLAQRRRATGGLGVLKVWAAGRSDSSKTPMEELEDARAHTINAHRESVLWYLRRQLEACSELQMSMMEIRLVRDMEKSKSRLYKAHGATLPSSTTDALELSSPVRSSGGVGDGMSDKVRRTQVPDGDASLEPGAQLSSEQLQLLAEENQDMLKHFEDTLDQVRTAERSLIEISELQTTLANNLAVQSAHIDQLVADTLYTTENVGGGNKQLKRATERTSTAKYVFYSSCAFSLFLIFWDLIF